MNYICLFLSPYFHISILYLKSLFIPLLNNTFLALYASGKKNGMMENRFYIEQIHFDFFFFLQYIKNPKLISFTSDTLSIFQQIIQICYCQMFILLVYVCLKCLKYILFKINYKLLSFQHRVPKEYHDRGPRLNLTFRTVHPLEEYVSFYVLSIYIL